MGTTAAVYARISLDKREGEGVDRQLAACRKIADERGWETTEYVDNDRSAYRQTPRPSWDAMLAALRAGEVSSVLSWANDRLYRRTRDQLDLIEAVGVAGGKIITVQDGEIDPRKSDGRMRATILSSVAEFESARKAERVAAAAEQRAANGHPHGRPSYGWRWADQDAEGNHTPGRWELDPDAAALIREAADRVLSGETCGAIVRDWNERGLPTPSVATEWNHRSLRKLLRRPSTAGLREHRGEVVGQGNWEPILDVETWERVGRALSPAAPQRKPRRYLLSGVTVCSMDGERMTGHHARRRGYRCVSCGQRIAADQLDELVTSTVLEVLRDPRLAQRIAAARSGDDVTAAALAEIAEADEALTALAAMVGAGDLTLVEYRAAREAASARREAAQRRLEDQRDVGVLARIAGSEIDAETLWNEASMGWRRQVLSALFERIEIGPSNLTGWEPDRVSLVWRT